MSESGVAASDVVGLGFDATCSLVCLDGADAPVGVDPLSPNDSDRNVIVWLDHRATEQASRINALKHDALRTVGGVISPEMEMPKLLWLKENFPDKWVASEDVNGASSPSSSSSSGRFSKFFDLADFLVYRCPGTTIKLTPQWYSSGAQLRGDARADLPFGDSDPKRCKIESMYWG